MTPDPTDSAGAVALLRRPEVVRERCAVLLAEGEAGRLDHFAVDLDRLDDAAALVVDEIRRNYPTGTVPPHSRWRHFVIGGEDRWNVLRGTGIPTADADEIARIRFDLAVISVLLDAGAGSAWSWCDPRTGLLVKRSEGLALASLEMFAGGLFSSDPERPLRADAAALSSTDVSSLARAFQVGSDNPLEGLEGRAALLRRLGVALGDRPHLFGSPARIGNLYDGVRSTGTGSVRAPDIMAALLDGFAPIWQGRLRLGEHELGDVWRHPSAHGPGLTDGFVPFHKLTQWLAYSLIEPLEDAGVQVQEVESLTGLAEYRNGGLFIDAGVLLPRDPRLLAEAQPVDSVAVVEWRALTVALLDRLAIRVREYLGLDEAALPLASILQGGTWSAGRRIARATRPNGEPPIRIVSDGTVF